MILFLLVQTERQVDHWNPKATLVQQRGAKVGGGPIPALVVKGADFAAQAGGSVPYFRGEVGRSALTKTTLDDEGELEFGDEMPSQTDDHETEFTFWKTPEAQCHDDADLTFGWRDLNAKMTLIYYRRLT